MSHLLRCCGGCGEVCLGGAVSGGVDCVHSEGVGGSAREAGVGVGAGRRSGGAGGDGVAVGAVAGDADVVGRGVPGERQRSASGPARRAGRGCLAPAVGDGRVHVGVELRGEGRL